MTTARDVAARVIERVEREESFAAAVLETELTRHVQLGPRDRALATEIVYGALRVQPWLLDRLGRAAHHGIAKLDSRVRAHLVVAAYQLAFTRVPAFAAVNDAVQAVRLARGERLASFANALLRRFASGAAAIDGAERQRALLESTPAWLRGALTRTLGEQGAREFVLSGAMPPAVVLRVEHAAERTLWIERLRAAAPDARFEPGPVSPLAIAMRGGGKPQRLPGYDEGAWSIQEEGAQLAALAVGAKPGERVLDACAGRGNKTAILARAIRPDGAVDACDAIPSKLERLRVELERLGLRASATYGVDWRIGAGDVTQTYDRVLVDAPCSGIGTIRRRPEIATRRRSIDLETTASSQVAIVSRAAERVRPGGTLVYVVCSVLREECEDVVEAVVRARGELAPAAFESPEARAVAGVDASAFRLLPHVHGTDGYFVAQLRSQARAL